MLNPSTADHRKDDPTIRRCMGFARAWGFDELVVVNLFGFRSPSPKAMKAALDPVGPENDVFLRRAAESCTYLVCAWGAHGTHMKRDTVVRSLLQDRDLRFLRMTKDKHPSHPLYLPAALLPQRWH